LIAKNKNKKLDLKRQTCFWTVSIS